MSVKIGLKLDSNCEGVGDTTHDAIRIANLIVNALMISDAIRTLKMYDLFTLGAPAKKIQKPEVKVELYFSRTCIFQL